MDNRKYIGMYPVLTASDFSYDSNRKLGSGVSSDVCVGKWNNTNVAAKFVKKSPNGTLKDSIREFQSEQRFLTLFMDVFKRNPNDPAAKSIVSIFLGGYVLDEFNYVVLLDFADQGNLENKIWLEKRIHNKSSLDWSLYYSVIKNIANALEFLQRYFIVHRDIKAANILLFTEGKGVVAKLCDFGYAKYGCDDSDGIAGSPLYYAPEILMRGNDQNYASDMYAFSLVLLHMVNLVDPYLSFSFKVEADIKEHVAVQNKRDNISRFAPEKLAHLITWGWQKVDKRITANQLVEELKTGLEEISPKLAQYK